MCGREDDITNDQKAARNDDKNAPDLVSVRQPAKDEERRGRYDVCGDRHELRVVAAETHTVDDGRQKGRGRVEGDVDEELIYRAGGSVLVRDDVTCLLTGYRFSNP